MGLLIRVKVALVVLRVVAQIANLDADDALGIHAPLGIEGDLGADVGIRLVGPGLAGNIVNTGPGAGRIDLLLLGQAEGNLHVLVEGLRAGFIQIEADQHPVIVAIEVQALRLHQRGGLDRGAVLHGEGGLLRRAGNGNHTGAVAALVVHHNAVPLGAEFGVDRNAAMRHFLVEVKGGFQGRIRVPAVKIGAFRGCRIRRGFIGAEALVVVDRCIIIRQRGRAAKEVQREGLTLVPDISMTGASDIIVRDGKLAASKGGCAAIAVAGSIVLITIVAVVFVAGKI